ncbi:MAG: DUF359 domain-containing protein [Euryarchaeota archaeon]|nr:DUF359 domain-containing protein [Euryarchaeota archaeon]
MSTESSPSKFAELRCPKGGWFLPPHMRGQLTIGLGRLVNVDDLPKELKGCEMLIAVGDMVSCTLLDNGFTPNLIVFDLKTERRAYTPLAEKLAHHHEGIHVKVKNPAGHITAELMHELGAAMERDVPTKLQVEGEEDLAALACAAMAPLGTCLMYGLPGQGMALLRIDEDVAGQARTFIDAMEELN